MGSWRKDERHPPQAVLGIIEGLLHRVACPTYLGTISLYIGWSLDRTTQMMEILQDRGIVKPLTPEERKAMGFPSEANVWQLVEKPSVTKARW